MKVFIKSVLGVLVFGLLLLVIGFVTGASLTSIKEVFTDTSEYVEYHDTINESFTKVIIHADSKNIEIRQTAELLPTLDYYLKETETMIFSIKGTDELNIKLTVKNKWIPSLTLGIVPKDLRTIYLNLNSTYTGPLTITSYSGNIDVDGTFAATSVSATSGNVKLQGTYENINATVISGNITISDATVDGTLLTKATSGNISIINSAANGALDMNVQSGNNTLKHVLATSYHVQATSGNCNLTMDQAEADYEYQLRVTSGIIHLNGRNVAKEFHAGVGVLIFAKTTSGNITIATN